LSLLDLKFFEIVFGPFEGRRLGLVRLDGNVGDQLIDIAAEQLLRDFRISFRIIRPEELDRGALYHPVDAIVVSGGGNMGSMYPVTQRQRREALSLGAPVTILPQTFTDANEDTSAFAKIFVRERGSLKLAPGSILAPDLALGLRPPWDDEGMEAHTGVWLRNDRERKVTDPGMSLGDPVAISRSIEDYIGLASKFEHIVTDRLHFAVAGLLIGRRVTLLPNSYFKNRSMYETWLRDLGCRWRNSVDGVRTDRPAIIENLWKRLSTSPSSLVPWNHHPARDSSWELVHVEDKAELHRDDGTSVRLNPSAALVWSLCDGSWSVEDLCFAIAEQYRQEQLAVARDVQAILQGFRANAVIDTKTTDAADTEQGKPAPHISARPCIHVDLMTPRKKHGRLRWEARVRGTSRGDFLLWFECDPRWRHAMTRRADPFLLASLPRAMNDGADLRITGAAVDSVLLDHLDEYQRAWRSWRPEHLQVINILAEETTVRSDPGRPAVAAFSGGVDSSYTVFRHCIEPDGRRNRELGAVVISSGLDIPVNDRDGYRNAVARLRPVISEAGIELIEVATNFRYCLSNWEMEHGTGLAAVLHLFSGRFSAGLIASTAPYELMFSWGSNPVTDPMLGGGFEILHDSAGVLRFEKLRALTRWPTALSRLRVCWQGRDTARNCGHCIKCYHLAMGLQALRVPLDCFNDLPTDVELAKFAEKAGLAGLEKVDLSCTLEKAKGLQAPWVAVLRERLGLSHETTSAAEHPEVAR